MNNLLTFFFVNEFNAGTPDKYAQFYVLLNEVILAAFRGDLQIVGRELRLSRNFVCGVAFNFFVEKDVGRGFTNAFVVYPDIFFECSAESAGAIDIECRVSVRWRIELFCRLGLFDAFHWYRGAT